MHEGVTVDEGKNILLHRGGEKEVGTELVMKNV